MVTISGALEGWRRRLRLRARGGGPPPRAGPIASRRGAGRRTIGRRRAIARGRPVAGRRASLGHAGRGGIALRWDIGRAAGGRRIARAGRAGEGGVVRRRRGGRLVRRCGIGVLLARRQGEGPGGGERQGCEPRARADHPSGHHPPRHAAFRSLWNGYGLFSKAGASPRRKPVRLRGVPAGRARSISRCGEAARPRRGRSPRRWRRSGSRTRRAWGWPPAGRNALKRDA